MTKSGNAHNKADITISRRYRPVLHYNTEFNLIQLRIMISHIVFIFNNYSPFRATKPRKQLCLRDKAHGLF